METFPMAEFFSLIYMQVSLCSPMAPGEFFHRRRWIPEPFHKCLHEEQVDGLPLLVAFIHSCLQ